MRSARQLAACLTMILLPQLVPAESVSKAEVLAAIQSAVESRGHIFPKGACSDRLEMGVSMAKSSAAGLMVTEIKFDRALGQVRFLLRSKSDSKVPPFYAWCSYESDAAREVSAEKLALEPVAENEEAALGPVLVDVHRAAQLFLHSAHSATLLRVRPLQSGHKDERVRVRLPLNGKMLDARVIGPDALEAAF